MPMVFIHKHSKKLHDIVKPCPFLLKTKKKNLVAVDHYLKASVTVHSHNSLIIIYGVVKNANTAASIINSEINSKLVLNKEKGRALNEAEVDFILAVMVRWI